MASGDITSHIRRYSLRSSSYCWSCFFFEMTWCEISLYVSSMYLRGSLPDEDVAATAVSGGRARVERG